jgi:hypothetical protein
LVLEFALFVSAEKPNLKSVKCGVLGCIDFPFL